MRRSSEGDCCGRSRSNTQARPRPLREASTLRRTNSFLSLCVHKDCCGLWACPRGADGCLAWAANSAFLERQSKPDLSSRQRSASVLTHTDSNKAPLSSRLLCGEAAFCASRPRGRAALDGEDVGERRSWSSGVWAAASSAAGLSSLPSASAFEAA